MYQTNRTHKVVLWTDYLISFLFLSLPLRSCWQHHEGTFVVCVYLLRLSVCCEENNHKREKEREDHMSSHLGSSFVDRGISAIQKTALLFLETQPLLEVSFFSLCNLI